MKHHIVIIDDDEDDIDILQQAIRKVSPDQVCMAYSVPAEAIMAMTEPSSSTVPRYIFVDYNMPRMNGIECVLALRNDKRYSEAVITLVSTGMDQLDQRLFRDLGVSFWYSKPTTLGAYNTMLNEVFGR